MLKSSSRERLSQPDSVYKLHTSSLTSGTPGSRTLPQKITRRNTFWPQELWGAYNALKLGAIPGLRAKPSFAASDSAAFSSSHEFDILNGCDPRRSILKFIDFKARLTIIEVLSVVLLPILLIWGIIQSTIKPTYVGVKLGVVLAACYALFAAILRAVLLERQYKRIQRPYRDLSMPDSLFSRVYGIDVHYKRKEPSQGTPSEPLVMHCLHGFGANEWSYSRVTQPLADKLRAVVSAHDTPGFGLTQRRSNVQYYTRDFDAQVARHFLYLNDPAPPHAPSNQQYSEHSPPTTPKSQTTTNQYFPPNQPPPTPSMYPPPPEKPTFGPQGSGSNPSGSTIQSHKILLRQNSGSSADSFTSDDLSSDGEYDPYGAEGRRKRYVLAGHSLGGFSAATSVIQNPQGVAALVLIAPAIATSPLGEAGFRLTEAGGIAQVAGIKAQKCTASGVEVLNKLESMLGDTLAKEKKAKAASREGLFGGIKEALGQLGEVIGVLGHTLVSYVAPIIAQILQPFLVTPLRSAVRNKAFWERGLGLSYFNADLLTPSVVDMYRSPQLIKGWEGGLLRLVLARFLRFKMQPDAAATADELKKSIEMWNMAKFAQRLAKVVAENDIKVLIIHGTDDRVVPIGNSRRLVSQLPQAQLVEMSKCGHQPQEERPEDFVTVVQNFLEQESLSTDS